jgi:hypothetical protein
MGAQSNQNKTKPILFEICVFVFCSLFSARNVRQAAHQERHHSREARRHVQTNRSGKEQEQKECVFFEIVVLKCDLVVLNDFSFVVDCMVIIVVFELIICFVCVCVHLSSHLISLSLSGARQLRARRVCLQQRRPRLRARRPVRPPQSEQQTRSWLVGWLFVFFSGASVQDVRVLRARGRAGKELFTKFILVKF